MTSPQPVRQEPTLSALVQMRTETDAEIPIVWLLLPLASYLLWAVFAVAWWSVGPGLGTSSLTPVISGLCILGITASAAGPYVVFRLLNRANEHSGSTPVRTHDTLGFALIIISIVELFSAFVLGLAGSLILIYLTVGAFSLFLIDLSIRDPTDHFLYHSQLEADMLRALPDSTSGGMGFG